MTTLKRIVVLGAGLSLSLFQARSAELLYENIGQVNVAPQIDAFSFLNSGSFNVGSALPYETQNTTNFINTGTMSGSPGFRFETIDSTGFRRPALNFFNGVDAQVFATSPGRILGIGGSVNTGSAFENPQILVSAQNITNKGRLHADADGLVRLIGNKVDISRSSVGILPYAGGSGFVTETNFIPDVGIYDIFWGQSNDGSSSFRPAGMVAANRNSTNFTVTTPAHGVTNEIFVRGFRNSLRLTNAMAFVVTNAYSPTNWLVQAVFVQVNDPELQVDVRFAPSTISTNMFTTPIVQFQHSETNVLAGGRFLNQLYLYDKAAAETNFVELTNLITRTTFMPSNYEVTRATPPGYITGVPANATNFAILTNINAAIKDLPSLIHNPSYSNAPVVTNVYAAYRFNVTNVSAVLPDLPGASLTNLPGRVEIVAEELNLNRTRIRGEGIVSIKAKNLSGTNSVLDVQNIAIDLKPSDGNLVVRDLAPDQIERLTGLITTWTSIWTNQVGMRTIAPDPANPGTMVTNDVPVDINFHLMVVDSAQVLTRLDVFVPNFTARSTNVVVSDTLRVKESLLVDAENLTLVKTLRTFGTGTNATTITNFGKIILTNTVGYANTPILSDWNSNSFPRLKNLTNEGIIAIPSQGIFGADRSEGMFSVVNRGQIRAYNQAYRVQSFQNSGIITNTLGAGAITLEAKSATLTGGIFAAGGEIQIAANDLVLRSYTNRTSSAFILTVTNSVSEGGAGASNRIACEGFQMWVRPKAGDLLGTTVESSSPPFLAIPHVWAGENRGPTTGGFTNNMALGRLVIKSAFESLHSFSGPSTNNALYVDFLEFQGPATNDVQSALEIKPGFTIYFADSNLPADKLNGLFEGRLVWVKDFVGPSSAVGVSVGGSSRVVLMNRALRESATIDTDGDGIINFLDASPRDDMNQPPMTLSDITLTTSPRSISFSWPAAPNSVYRVEYSPSLEFPRWTSLMTFTNTASTQQPARVKDRISDDQQRYYRVLSGQ